MFVDISYIFLSVILTVILYLTFTLLLLTVVSLSLSILYPSVEYERERMEGNDDCDGQR